MKFKIFTLGCKVNQYESEFIKKTMTAQGYEYSQSDIDCGLFIINSCTVTAVSDKKCRQLIHRLRRESPESVILLCGCMPQAFPTRFEDFSLCDIVVGNTSRSDIPGHVNQFLQSRQQIIDIDEHNRGSEDFEQCSVSDFSERTRAFVKIEDGCDRFCSYCIIPFARGAVRSKPPRSLFNEALALAGNGFREIVLVGINLSAYGSDMGLSLCDAVECVANVEGIERIRLGSLEPEYLDLQVTDRLKSCKKLCSQFHLSLQSGCNSTLSRMNRLYTTDDYRAIVGNLRNSFDNCSITTDVMVGFPGEDESEFSQSLEFVRSIGFAKVHVFPYSRRSGTVAFDLPLQISTAVKQSRARQMTDVCNLSRKSFLSSQIGRTEDVLFEQQSADGGYVGYSRNYTPVSVFAKQDISGQCKNVLITGSGDDLCTGEFIG